MPDLSLQHPFELIAAAAAEPIKVTNAKKQMLIEHSDDNALIERLINVAFIWVLHIKIRKHNTFIAVLEAQITSDNLVQDREMKDVKEASRSIASKLDSIELALKER